MDADLKKKNLIILIYSLKIFAEYFKVPLLIRIDPKLYVKAKSEIS